MKKFLYLICALTITLASCSKISDDELGQDGAGQNDPSSSKTDQDETTIPTDTTFIVNNIADLVEFRDYVNDGYAYINAVLTSDISLATVCGESLGSWVPIGNNNDKFKGTFDGGGYTISNLYINETDSQFLGFFGCTNRNAIIKNLSVNGSVTGYSSIAGIVGMSAGLVLNCHNACDVTCTSSTLGSIGGIIGYGDYALNCYNSGAITTNSTTSNIGGIVGYGGSTHDDGVAARYKPFTNCYNSGKITNNKSANNAGSIMGFQLYCYYTSCYYQDDTYTYAYGSDQTGKLSETEMKDGTLLDFLNAKVAELGDYDAYYWISGDTAIFANMTGKACNWIEGDDGYPTLDF